MQVPINKYGNSAYTYVRASVQTFWHSVELYGPLLEIYLIVEMTKIFNSENNNDRRIRLYKYPDILGTFLGRPRTSLNCVGMCIRQI